MVSSRQTAPVERHVSEERMKLSPIFVCMIVLLSPCRAYADLSCHEPVLSGSNEYQISIKRIEQGSIYDAEISRLVIDDDSAGETIKVYNTEVLRKRSRLRIKYSGLDFLLRVAVRKIDSGEWRGYRPARLYSTTIEFGEVSLVCRGRI